MVHAYQQSCLVHGKLKAGVHVKVECWCHECKLKEGQQQSIDDMRRNFGGQTASKLDSLCAELEQCL